jgi:hypothetical protein
VAGRPLRPATDHRLGRPLPHQLANRTQAPPSASLATLSSPELPSGERMRNYPAFPRATPHQWAGSPRVPHPSATFAPEGTTFDLHALGTPPALILSQDQTLHQNLCPPGVEPAEVLFVTCVRASSRCAPAPRQPKLPACQRRVGPPSSAARTEIPGATSGPDAGCPPPVPVCTTVSGSQPVNVRRCLVSA